MLFCSISTRGDDNGSQEFLQIRSSGPKGTFIILRIRVNANGSIQGRGTKSLLRPQSFLLNSVRGKEWLDWRRRRRWIYQRRESLKTWSIKKAVCINKKIALSNLWWGENGCNLQDGKKDEQCDRFCTYWCMWRQLRCAENCWSISDM